MADQSHLDILRQGVEAWNPWRSHHLNITPDLSEANLSKASLLEANLSEVNLFKADLSEADLRWASLVEANLSEANLVSAYLFEADLREADLTEADLSEASLTDADFTAADFTEANLYMADFIGANLSGAKLRRANLSRAGFANAYLFGADLAEAYLFRADLSETKGLTQKQIDRANGNETTELPEGLKRPAAWSQCRDWHAWYDHESPGPATLRVAGKCEVPKGTYEVKLTRPERQQGVNLPGYVSNLPDSLLERRLLLERKVVPSAAEMYYGPGVETHEARYEETTDFEYETVMILPDGVTLPVQKEKEC